MPLPFAKNDGKRQFACFVCGSLQPDRTSFRNHIVENHEEGKDYIICCLDHCRCPVRDMRAHFKAIHPHTPCPKSGQMRAMTWRDPKDPSKKRKVSFKEGYFPSIKNRKNLRYRSSWEEDVYKLLEKMDEVVRYEVEPLAIEYAFNGELHNYLPDLRIYFRDGHKEIWEIKPQSQQLQEINLCKWDACLEYCKKRGWEFKVINETEIGKLKNKLRLRN